MSDNKSEVEIWAGTIEPHIGKYYDACMNLCHDWRSVPARLVRQENNVKVYVNKSRTPSEYGSYDWCQVMKLAMLSLTDTK